MEKTPLRFDTREEADTWLKATGHYGYGIVHRTGIDFIIIQYLKGSVWAFISANEAVLLPDW